MQLVSLQLSAIYFWSAWDKTSWAFLSGERLQAIFMSLYFENLPTAAWIVPATCALAIVTVAFEYFIAFGIHWRRIHWWLLPAGIALHVIFYLVLPVSVFSANMVLMYLSLLDPDAIHRFIDRLQESPGRPGVAEPVPHAEPEPSVTA
jgi:hypothetical protein